MAGTAISDATLTTPVFADSIPFARTADAVARRFTNTGLETLLFDRAIVINTTGADADFNVKASGVANALFVQGSDGFVGGGTASPETKLHVSGGDILLDNNQKLRGKATNDLNYILIGRNPIDNALRLGGGGGFDIKVYATAGSSGLELFISGSDGYVGMGLEPTANMAGLSIEAGRLTLKETTTPTADENYGKIYTKNDNMLYFQSGAGVEYSFILVETP